MKKIKNLLWRLAFLFLEHTTVDLPGGGQVVVLNTGALIGPEAEAMLQALHSRSTGGIWAHLKALVARGAKKFMSTFYVGYGHKSIGDCGTTTIFIEGVSMLVAKAIQDWPLYSGQEASTRYIDFAEQRFVNPAGNAEGKAVLEEWRSFYISAIPEVVSALKERYPRQDGEKESAYEKAINARAFDIMRGFLPAGATTNLAWHTNLRQAADKLMLLLHHPLLEVRQTAEAMEDALNEAFPSSFGHKRYEATEKYNESLMRDYLYTDSSCPDFEVSDDSIDRSLLSEYREALENRPQKTELPKYIKECGTLRFRFLLDFGSFRDIQRQRAVMQRMPLVVMNHGFNEWYMDELTPDLRGRAEELLKKQERSILALDVSPEERQYYVAMGYNLPNRLTGDLHALSYLVELRATRFVHPTLRKRAREMAAVLEKLFGEHGLVLHLDTEPDRFDVKRGEHDIIKIP